MAQPQHTRSLAHLKEAVTALFCLVGDAYALLNPKWRGHESIKRLSDSGVLTFLRNAGRFLSHLFPGVAGLHLSSLHRRVRKLGRFLEPLRLGRPQGRIKELWA